MTWLVGRSGAAMSAAGRGRQPGEDGVGHRLPGVESQVSLVRRQIEAVGRMDLDLLESLHGEWLAVRRAQDNGLATAGRAGGAAAAPAGVTAGELRQLEQLLADRLDERIRACTGALYHLAAGRRAAIGVSSAHWS